MTLQDWEALLARMAARLNDGWELEPASVLAAVAAHRNYWRPQVVRVLLLAESHVLTHDHDLAAQVRLEPFGHAGAPTEFVRLVYCLGYGEKSLLDGVLQPNTGTWQFWKLFAACVRDPKSARVLQGAEPSWRKRIEAKTAVLEELKARGVWLLDASPVALYRPGGGKPTAKKLNAALAVAWEEYAGAIVREVAPRAVMVVGKMVHDVLGERVRHAVGSDIDVQWMYQPQARVSAAKHTDGLERLREMVEKHGRRSS